MGHFTQVPTALYRFFDDDGRLLYVGIAKDPDKRAKEHRRYQPWWPLVADRTVEWLPTRSDAYRAESEAIATEEPLFNRAGRPDDEWATTPWEYLVVLEPRLRAVHQKVEERIAARDFGGITEDDLVAEAGRYLGPRRFLACVPRTVEEEPKRITKGLNHMLNRLERRYINGEMYSRTERYLLSDEAMWVAEEHIRNAFWFARRGAA